MAQATKWDEEFEKELSADKEISDSDAHIEAIQKEIENGHNGLLAFERVAVDA